jgi:hypothetical protein
LHGFVFADAPTQSEGGNPGVRRQPATEGVSIMKIVARTTVFLAAAALVGAWSLTEMPPAAAGDPVSVRHLTSVSANSDQAVSDRVEARITELHAKLHITADQAPQWEAFAAVMRENAQSIHALMVDKHQNAAAMSAVDDLTSYQDIAKAHVDGLAKLIPTFQALYATMSDRQKKTADMLFGQHEHREMHSSN